MFLPVLAQNETINETTNASLPWYDSYVSGVLSGDTITLITAIIGLTFVYIFGKIAFRFIKWAIIILVILLLIRILL